MQEELEDKMLDTAANEEKEQFSYSKLSMYLQCPFRFHKKYDEHLKSDRSTLALELGTVCHKGFETAGRAILNGDKPDADTILQWVMNGEFPDEKIHGVNELSSKYFEDWIVPDNKTGMTYLQKLAHYRDALQAFIESQTSNPEWRVNAVEREFKVPFENIILYGFIDREDINEKGETRIIDYKTSKAVYRSQDIKLPLQMVAYSIAEEYLSGKRPTAWQYEFILINQTQPVTASGFVDKGIQRIQDTLKWIGANRESGVFAPRPSPLCHWCEFCKHNPNADPTLQHICPYHSLWTPTNKTYAVNQEFDPNKAFEESGKEDQFWF